MYLTFLLNRRVSCKIISCMNVYWYIEKKPVHLISKKKKLPAPDVIFDTVHIAADQEAGAGKNVSRVG